MSTKTKKTVLLYPITGKGGAEEFVDRKTFIETKAKEYAKVHKDLDINSKSIKLLLDVAEDDSVELEDDADEGFKTIVGELKPLVAQAQAKAKEADTAKEADKNAKLTILKTALSGSIPAEVLNAKFQVHSTGVTIAADAMDAEILSKMGWMLDANAFSAWAIGDLGNALQDRGQQDLLEQFMAETGRAGSTVYKHMLVARTITPEKRSTKLLPTVIAEIVTVRLSDNDKTDAAKKEKLLAEAVEKKWNSREARAAASAARTKKAGKQGGAKLPTFLVVPKDGTAPYFQADEQGLDDKVVLINLKTRAVLSDQVPKEGGKEGEVVIGWLPIETK